MAYPQDQAQAICYNNDMICAVDIGGTKIRLAVATDPNNIVRDHTFHTPADQNEALARIEQGLRELAGETAISAVGIASPGPLDRQNGVIIHPRTIDWHDFAIVRNLSERLKCPVRLDHDATLGGVAEARLGAGAEHRVVLYVTVSTGIGSAIIVEGTPLPSKHNSEGGWQVIPADSGQPIQYQKLASGVAITEHFGRIAAELTNPRDWQVVARHIAGGLFNMITVIQPDIVVLAGGVSVHFGKFYEPMMRTLHDFTTIYPLPPIKQAEFVETAPLLGALLLAQDQLG